MFLNLISTPKLAPADQKNSPEGHKKCKKAKNLAELKIKLKIEAWILGRGQVQKHFWNLPM